MGEAELFSIISEAQTQIAGLFGQIISINLAMIVGIYYFLRRGSLGLRLFAYIVYLIGMFRFLGLMLIQSNVAVGGLEGLRALPSDHLSRPAQRLLVVSDSWIGIGSSAVGNIAFWVLLIGVTYLLFFWKDHEKAGEKTAAHHVE
jgi:hypothetical protein